MLLRRPLALLALCALAACSLLEEEEEWATIETGISSVGFDTPGSGLSLQGQVSSFTCAEIEGYDGGLGLVEDTEISRRYVWEGQRCSEFGYTRDGGLGPGDRRFVGPNGGTQRAPRGFFSSGGGGNGGGGGNLDLRCPGTLPSGFQCLSRNGQQAPVQFDLPVLHGTWVESSFEVCMTLNANGTSNFRYRSGFPPESSRWGAVVNQSGQRQPNTTTFFVVTGSGDPQIALLTWSGSGFTGFQFRRASCSW
jgi:hypothetical protein